MIHDSASETINYLKTVPSLEWNLDVSSYKFENYNKVLISKKKKKKGFKKLKI